MLYFFLLGQWSWPNRALMTSYIKSCSNLLFSEITCASVFLEETNDVSDVAYRAAQIDNVSEIQ